MRYENKNETTEANPVSAAMEVEADQGVLAPEKHLSWLMPGWFRGLMGGIGAGLR